MAYENSTTDCGEYIWHLYDSNGLPILDTEPISIYVEKGYVSVFTNNPIHIGLYSLTAAVSMVDFPGAGEAGYTFTVEIINVEIIESYIPNFRYYVGGVLDSLVFEQFKFTGS